MNRIFYKTVPLVLILLLFVYFTYEVYARSTGISGRTNAGCQASGCHGNSANSATGISVLSGSLSVEPNSTNDYTIRVSNSNSSQTKAGINIAVKSSSTGETNSGTLSAESGSGLTSSGGELIHSSPKNLSGSNADFSFKWTAPSTPGTYYLKAAANAVNGDGSTSGDQWNFMTVQEIIVKGIQLTEPLASNLSYCLGNQVTIKWTQTGLSGVTIELSTNSGSSWETTIATGVAPASGTYTWTIPNNFQTGSNFRLRVRDDVSSSLSSAMASNFSIAGGFSILSHPESKEICGGTAHTLKVSVSGTGTKFQWYKDNNIINGATDSLYAITNADASKSGNYKVVVSSNCQADLSSNTAAITVLPPNQISAQPQNIAVCLGAAATFSITATGSNISYKWYHNNQLINNATEQTLVITSAGDTDAGAYYCEISGTCGTLKSNIAELTVNNQPVITEHPVNATICDGKTASFGIVASGSGNFYEWYHNEIKLNVPNSSSLIIENAGISNQGDYHCIVFNSCGEQVRSQSAKLNVSLLPVITTNPKNLNLTVGNNLSLSVVASNGSLSYQWRKDNVNIANANESIYEITNVSKSDAGKYDCIVSNSCGSTSSVAANVLVEDKSEKPRISLISDNLNVKVIAGNNLDSLFRNFVANTGGEPLNIDSLVVTGNDKDLFELELSKIIINPDESADLKIKLNSSNAGTYQALAKIYSNSENGAMELPLLVKLIEYMAVSDKETIDLGNVEIDNEYISTFVVTNTGNEPLTISSISLGCNNEDDVSFLNLPELPYVLQPDATLEISFKFLPKTEYQQSCDFVVRFLETEMSVEVIFSANSILSSVNENVNSFASVHPNPASNQVQISFSEVGFIEGDLIITNSIGEIVKVVDSNMLKGVSQFTWDCKDSYGNNVSNGTYTILFKNLSGLNIKKLTIIK